MKPDNLILECVVGSHMYNLQTETSDYDIKGIYIEDTNKFFHLNKPKLVKDHTDPDWAYYEIEQFCNLAAKANPTITELLWANEYRILTPLGEKLKSIREAFLSKKAKDSYLGYAMSQVARKYRNATDITQYRAGKHVRHTWRLCKQYEELAKTGKLRVKLTEEERQECFEFVNKTYEECMDWFLDEEKKLNRIESILPDKPDYDTINQFLEETRIELLKKP